MEGNKQIAKLEANIELNSTESIMAFGKDLMKSGLCPTHIKKPEDALIAILTGKELGFKAMVSLHNVHPIGGKPTIGVHIKRGLLLKAGVKISVLKSYEPLYQYIDKDNLQYGENEIREGVKAGKYVLLLPVPPVGGYPKEKIQIQARLVDHETVIKFERKIKQPDGNWANMEHIETFRYSDAVRAGLVKDDGNWLKYPKNMCLSRCLGFGAAIIGDDILCGIYSTDEMCDVHNIPYTMSDNLEIKVEANEIGKEAVFSQD